MRVDSGVREGDAITPFYDPMIAKLIVHGADREEALGRMARALRECEVVGLYTNAAFLQRIVACRPFAEADLDTGLIERNHDALFEPQQPPRAALALACAALRARERDQLADGGSPWAALSNWRLNAGYRRTLEWHAIERDTRVTVTVDDDEAGKRLTIGDAQAQPFAWTRGATPLDFDVTLGGVRSSGRVYADGDTFHVFTQGMSEVFEWRNLLAHAGDAEHGGGRLTAPMPGKVIAVLVEAGQPVEAGTPLIVMEAMKMEHTIGAPSAGVVAEVLYDVGDQVADGAQLLVMSEG